jgi:hypothetical protein
MLHINAPVLIKIRKGIAINLAMTLSLAVENAVPQTRLKKEVADAIQAGSRTEQPTDADYEEYGKADTLSFWFIGGTSLAYRVGHEITQEDFDRAKAQIVGLLYRTKDERKSSDNDAPKTS